MRSNNGFPDQLPACEGVGVSAPDHTPTISEDQSTVKLSEEELSVSRRKVGTSTTRVEIVTIAHDELVDVELSSERVEVERVPIGRYVEAAPPVREEGDLTILSVVEEVIERRLLLREEVHIRRVRSTEHIFETVKLRRQEAVITETPVGGQPNRPHPLNRSIQLEPEKMNEETVVAVYDTAAHAEAAAADLSSAGISASAVSLHAANGTTSGNTTIEQPVREQSFWSSLFGGEPDHDTAVYDRSMSTGSTVVTVKASDANVALVMEILEGHHPIDIDERASGYGLMQTPRQPVATPVPAMGVASRSSAANGDTIQLSEESLAVGKRVVNRGGTRIRRFVVETPVEEQVTLHDEKVTLERRPVTDSRPVADSFSEKTIEMTATAEEAVVSKTARVVEEVGLRKEGSDRVETVRDTVRKEEVEVEQIPGTATTTSVTATPRNPKI